jgi:hypothetical protein
MWIIQYVKYCTRKIGGGIFHEYEGYPSNNLSSSIFEYCSIFIIHFLKNFFRLIDLLHDINMLHKLNIGYHSNCDKSLGNSNIVTLFLLNVTTFSNVE